MADEYVHGIVIKESSGEVRTIRSPSPYVVGLVGTALALGSTLKAEEPQVFFRKKAALEAVHPETEKGDRGSLYSAVIGVYEQTEATVVLVRAKSGSDSDIMAAIEKLTEAESLIGFKPKILAAPGFGNTNPKPPDAVAEKSLVSLPFNQVTPESTQNQTENQPESQAAPARKPRAA